VSKCVGANFAHRREFAPTVFFFKLASGSPAHQFVDEAFLFLLEGVLQLHLLMTQLKTGFASKTLMTQLETLFCVKIVLRKCKQPSLKNIWVLCYTPLIQRMGV
jgi:hypothetical protein